MFFSQYCNKNSDMAAIASMIDVHSQAASKDFWDLDSHAKKIGAAQWRKDYLVRRLKGEILRLPDKVIVEHKVSQFPEELVLYEGFESQVIELLGRLGQTVEDPSEKKKQQRRVMSKLNLAVSTIAVLHQ
jgi:hypothetical protein